MEDNFRVRVDKAFGSLSSSSPLTSLWSLTVDEIEKKEWRRDLNRPDDDQRPPSNLHAGAGGFLSSNRRSQESSSNFRAELESDIQNLDEGDEEDDYCGGDEQQSPGAQKKLRMRIADGDNDDELDVRSSIGLDCTLDYEEEEDEFDKVAVGREKGGDRLYMRDVAVADYDIDYVHTYADLQDSFPSSSHGQRDPRANHLAAKLRLKEDTEAAGNFHSLDLTDHAQTPTTNNEDIASIPKPILKKRPTDVQPKSFKRVRFGPRFETPVNTIHHVKADSSVAEPKMELAPQSEPLPPSDEDVNDDITCRRLPDFLRHPSKYTRYTLDSSSDMDDESNRRAYMDFVGLLNKRTIIGDEVETVDSSKPPTFTPRKTHVMKNMRHHEDVSQAGSGRIGIIAAGDAQDTDIYAMEEDDPDIVGSKVMQKPGRQYRAKTTIDSDQQVAT